MGTLLQVLHVLGAVLLIGPLVHAPMRARRAITDRNGPGVRAAAREMGLFGIGSVIVAGFGALTLLTSDRYTFATPWVVVSITLYLVALGLIYLFAVPALRGAARLVDEGVPIGTTGSTGDTDEAAEPRTFRATADDLRAKERLDATTGRVTLAGLLVLVVFAVIAVLMVVRPFGA